MRRSARRRSAAAVSPCAPSASMPGTKQTRWSMFSLYVRVRWFHWRRSVQLRQRLGPPLATRCSPMAATDCSYMRRTRPSVREESSHCLSRYSYRESARAPRVTSALTNSPVTGEMSVGYSPAGSEAGRGMSRRCAITRCATASYAGLPVWRESARNSSWSEATSATVEAPLAHAGLVAVRVRRPTVPYGRPEGELNAKSSWLASSSALCSSCASWESSNAESSPPSTRMVTSKRLIPSCSPKRRCSPSQLAARLNSSSRPRMKSVSRESTMVSAMR
mmetsp:Transcript_27686/g.70160  ORF Transcript_27686/g.70160 Transcript_27686/m.70160 type:complete len:277 (-) Transcript_27686:180-1010(-)